MLLNYSNNSLPNTETDPFIKLFKASITVCHKGLDETSTQLSNQFNEDLKTVISFNIAKALK
jgi:hypothetical protein